MFFSRIVTILPLFFVPTHQITDHNCLRTHPDILDADLEIINRFENYWQVTKEDVAKHVSLFSTRFKRAHEFVTHTTARMKLIGEGLALFKNISQKDFQIFLFVNYGNKVANVTKAISQYREDYETILKINSMHNRPVVGLYLRDRMKTYREELIAVEAVFGSKENSSIPVGYSFKDCLTQFKNAFATNYLHRMNFISCRINPAKKLTPEDSADSVIRACGKIQKAANSLNLTCEIMCRVSYPSHGTSLQGIVGSASDFQRFWCRIVELQLQDKSRTQIIMSAAFDLSPENYKEINVESLHAAKYHTGWWRRIETSSYDPSAFVEKVEELGGNRFPGNCTADCEFCNSTKKCCEGRTCEHDTSYQPFEEGESRLVCQSLLTTCSPRFPATFEKPSKTSGHIEPANTSLPLDTRESLFNASTITIFILAVSLFATIVMAFLIYRKGKFNNDSTQRLSNFFDL